MEYKDGEFQEDKENEDIEEIEIQIQEETEELQEAENPPKRKSKALYILREIITYMLCFIIALIIARGINIYVGQRTTVDGHSMEATLSDRDILIVDKLTYRFDDPERFDIIVFQPYELDDETFYVKRVIGLPGETIQIIDSNIYINNELLEENYGKAKIKKTGRAGEPIELGEDEYFVLGDNRNESLDSRFEEVGSVKRSSILGKAWARVYPFKTAQILKH